MEDLISLKSAHAVNPRPPQMTSIPAMLSLFQNEWDALALQTYTLQQNLKQTRQELSVALYQNDAAVRVIAQLTKERDEARASLAKISVARGDPVSSNGDAMQVDSAPLPASVIEKIDSVQQRYETLKICFCPADMVLVCQKLAGSDQSRRTGPPLIQYRTTRLFPPRSRYILVERFLLCMGLGISHSLQATPELQACSPSQRTNRRTS